MKKVLSTILVVAILLLAMSPRSQAEESLNVAGKRAKIVAKSAVYGYGGGLVIGLASQVFKQKTKNIFMFGSLGLYAGIILGLYVISTSSGPAPYEGPDTYEDFSYRDPASQKFRWNEKKGALDQPELKLNLVSLDF